MPATPAHQSLYQVPSVPMARGALVRPSLRIPRIDVTTRAAGFTITLTALDAVPYAVERAIENARSYVEEPASSSTAGADTADLLITSLTVQDSAGVMARVSGCARVRGRAPHPTGWAVPIDISTFPEWRVHEGAVALVARPDVAATYRGGHGDGSPTAAVIAVCADTCRHAATLAASWLGHTTTELANLARVHKVAIRARLSDGSADFFEADPPQPVPRP